MCRISLLVDIGLVRIELSEVAQRMAVIAMDVSFVYSRGNDIKVNQCSCYTSQLTFTATIKLL